ncbi:MAG: TraR/DksA C4-type zinc finger protein [Candidatus Omnitrophota bacterium]|nr:TraR/DksA C4-type zinc finger protein [Candidatus Omnitrophota bacterium]MBU1894311.1 TraR/DksA C4-type zinc finger protein [Candidatus Omnitrophota bacterium]
MVKKKTTGKGKAFTAKQLQAIRKKLIGEKAKILQELISLKGDTLNKSFKDASGDLSGYSFHMADMATDLYDREFSLELAEGERERLYAFDDAIKRIDSGEYGTCDYCGEPIPKQRLIAMPEAEYCIKCQEKNEKSSER